MKGFYDFLLAEDDLLNVGGCWRNLNIGIACRVQPMQLCDAFRCECSDLRVICQAACGTVYIAFSSTALDSLSPLLFAGIVVELSLPGA